MAKYICFFSITPEALARFIEKPEDRRGPVAKLAESLGARLDSYYWMFGKHDGFAIFDCPDSKTAAALSLAVSSAGAIKQMETHELITSEELISLDVSVRHGLRPRP